MAHVGRRMCTKCGTVFILERNASGEIGVVEGCRFIQADQSPPSRWRRFCWWIAAWCYDAATFWSVMAYR